MAEGLVKTTISAEQLAEGLQERADELIGVLISGIKPAQHGQRCPLWVYRRENIDPHRCDCWVGVGVARTLGKLVNHLKEHNK